MQVTRMTQPTRGEFPCPFLSHFLTHTLRLQRTGMKMQGECENMHVDGRQHELEMYA